jgi:hypothetical protein
MHRSSEVDSHSMGNWRLKELNLMGTLKQNGIGRFERTLVPCSYDIQSYGSRSTIAQLEMIPDLNTLLRLML